MPKVVEIKPSHTPAQLRRLAAFAKNAILSSARKYRVGMILAHQYLGQLDPKLLEAFSANTSIKFAGGVSNRDAKAMAAMMGCTSELIEAQEKGCFAASFRGLSKTAFPIRFPLGFMEAMPSMTSAEFDELRETMRQRYAVYVSQHGQDHTGGTSATALPGNEKPKSGDENGKDNKLDDIIDDAPKPWP